MSHGVTGLGERLQALHTRSAEAEQHAVEVSRQAHAKLLQAIQHLEDQETEHERSEAAAPVA